ncbi:MAG: hypothetical protein ACYDH9_18315 [Limisphaerales bacterium]
MAPTPAEKEPVASPHPAGPDCSSVTTELLILDDGRVLAHNLTPAVADLLSGLNPADESMKQRAAHPAKPKPAAGAC